MNRLTLILTSLALSASLLPTPVSAQAGPQTCVDSCITLCATDPDSPDCPDPPNEEGCNAQCGIAPPTTPPETSVGAPAPTPPPADVPRTLQNPLGTSDLRQVIGNIVRALLGFAGAGALLMFVWGGFQFMMAAGNPKNVEKGKLTLIWATVGLVVIFSAYTLLDTLIKALSG
ncbi:hypothetical protein EPO34_03280 [Patescibacteria group bacterium]|nr:MAG: hypothetical protein EPO34_03280 [Patescibacteria group bacterium]